MALKIPVRRKPGEYGSFIDRMLEVLRRSPVLHLDGGKTVEFKGIRKPAKTLSLSAEAVVTNGNNKPVAILFGPENGAISEKLVYEAAREAHAKNYSHLFVIGFAIQPVRTEPYRQLRNRRGRAGNLCAGNT